MKNLIQITATAILAFFAQPLVNAGTITVLGAGSGGAPIFVTTALDNIDIGTRVRIGTFLDLSASILLLMLSALAVPPSAQHY